MKHVLKLLFVVAFFLFSAEVGAQTPKLAHINSQELLTAMPEMDSAQVTLQKYQQELVSYLETMNVDYNKLYQDFLKEEKNLSEVARSSKMEELQDKQQRIVKFQEEADVKLQTKRNELMQPIFDKAKKAIEDVSKEQGFTYVFDVASGSSIIFQSPTAVDILEPVKKKLGVTK